MMCLISSSCRRTTSLPHNGPTTVHCNSGSEKENSSFCSFGLTEIRQKHNSIFSLWRRIWSHRLQGEREPGDLPAVPRYAFTASRSGSGRNCLGRKAVGSYPQVSLKNTFHLARRTCHSGHDIYSSQQTLGWHIHNSPAPFQQSLWGDRGDISAAVQKNSLFYSDVKESSLLRE